MLLYRPKKEFGLYYILGMMLLYNAILILAIMFVDSYVLTSLLKIFVLILDIYYLRYILIHVSLKYGLDKENLYIISGFKKYKISYKNIEGYRILKEKINGIKLTGFGTSHFALGKSVIKDIGLTNMFVTTNKTVVYIKASEGIYAVSPENISDFEAVLKQNNINQIEWEKASGKDTNLHKDKTFIIPFFIVSIIITVLTLNPFILYLLQKLPGKMPLNFDSTFIPVDYGTGKQFAFNQMIYGVLNMAILFCMYYASHFYAKYDRKSANRFIYVSLAIAAAFLFIQVRILLTFK